MRLNQEDIYRQPRRQPLSLVQLARRENDKDLDRVLAEMRAQDRRYLELQSDRIDNKTTGH
jgi:hypothetical protein